jgi:hypothetical protein
MNRILIVKAGLKRGERDNLVSCHRGLTMIRLPDEGFLAQAAQGFCDRAGSEWSLRK